MIVHDSELTHYAKKVVMVDGGFDPLHLGHIAYFESAARFDFPVLCNVQSDHYIREVKGRINLLPQEQRIKIIDALKSITYVHLCQTSTHDVLEKLKPLKYIKGKDWKEKGVPRIEQEICEKCNIEIVYLDKNLDSSTHILGNFLKNSHKANNARAVRALESYIHSQEEVDSDYYDRDYFKGSWRKNEENYSLEKRRELESQNPLNIKEVFNPQCVLDVGCGPGALMYFLYELGIECYGLDFSEVARELAHPVVRSKIITAPVTEYYDFKRKFDLVICREALEHLTVIQIYKTVKNLSRYTSKYLYLTTRFHPDPDGLLDVADDSATDPTHITLLNKDFLKVLCMLEGLSPRPDLEERLDWKKAGRVMVFEKA